MYSHFIKFLTYYARFLVILCILMVAADAFAFLFSSKVHGPKVGQHWEYLRIRGIKSGEVINVAARSNSPPKGEGGGGIVFEEMSLKGREWKTY